MKSFSVPVFYRSSLIARIKSYRDQLDPRKKDFLPTVLDCGPVEFRIARYFGFCYGVEHAINIAYQAIEQNPGRRIFLLSEMIHNPGVNLDLLQRGVRFILNASGEQWIKWDELTPDDIVIIPAFGTSIDIIRRLSERGIQPKQYDATCPFVQKVWNKGILIGKDRYTVIIHGKPSHEETRATFSHISVVTPTVIVKDYTQATVLSEIILEKRPPEDFYQIFAHQYSEGFDPTRDLYRIGVVNQTTMLASDTQVIVDLLKQTMIRKYQLDEVHLHEHFADTQDTLCYATHNNQQAVHALLKNPSDLAIVAGGYNSSNTTHLVELCMQKMTTYFIPSADHLLDANRIRHYSLTKKQEIETTGYLPVHRPFTVALTSGASCPDAVVEQIIRKLLSFFPDAKDPQIALEESIV